MRARHPRSAPRTKRAIAVTCLVGLVLFLLSMPSSSAPGDPIPGEQDLPQTRISGGGEGVVTTSQGAVVPRSRMYITMGGDSPVWGLLYNGLYNWPIEDPSTFAALCSRGRPCVPDPFYQPACATDDLSTQKRGSFFRSLIYPVGRVDGGVDVGLVGRVPVRLVAFGSLPATATLTMRSAREGGKVTPLLAQIWSTSSAATIGCDPEFDAPALTALIEGRIDISLSDLEVDGVPVDLGPHCRTVRSTELRLWGETDRGAYSPNSGGPLGAYDGLHPGSLGPLDSPVYVESRGRTIPASTGVDVPPFTGCGTGGDDLSPLVTAMASGPNNPVRAVQKPVVSHEVAPGEPFPREVLRDISACSPFGGQCPLPGPDAPDRPPLPDDD